MSDKHPLISMLERIYVEDDRAALAALRHGLDAGREATVYPYVARFFAAQTRRWDEQAYILVAALFAMHPGTGGMSLGAALRRVRDLSGSESVEQRFAALLNAHEDDVADHLRHAVAMARSREVLIDWNDLLQGVRGWRHEGRWVQRRWARDFWGHSEDKELS